MTDGEIPIPVKNFAITLILFFYFLAGCNLQALSQVTTLQLNATIPLPNVLGRIDHMAFDSKKQYIYIAALGNNSVEVVDLKNGKVNHSIKGLREPQGVVYLPETNSIFATNGYNGECDFFDADSYVKIKSIKLSEDADNVRYDSIEKKIYVGYGAGGMAVIDAVTLNLQTEIKLSGHPESFQINRKTNKIYVNIPFQKQIEVIDLGINLVTGIWKLAEVSSNFAMSLDETNHRLFIGCRLPAKLLVLNTDTGQTIASLDSDSDVDDVYYDKTNKQIYMSCGNGNIDIFQQINANDYKAIGKIITHSGARTSLFIPEMNKLVIASPAGFSTRAFLLIYNIK
jgi:YVTN family beta-propeller protein